ncbi:uncharacterized protein LOC110265686 isoform X2 [Arachis ipaensis]|uniref:uncharacterized protein LOC110265686 isoform X2 n=1 Tax=Arachis ipaensis TaxID=130454 RepID=UPI000A2B52A2|nr:uncharacterized protein LOC110265686 isoform X2 [Arachis ipaensis]XP_029150985.1 uncharacterized protein LOC112769395 [Arachis hypogaea]
MLNWLDKNRFIVSLDLALESYRRISLSDFGELQSWTKLLCVPDLIYYPEFLGFDFNVPRATRAICISDEDDEILLELWLDMEQKFVVYIEKFGGRVASEVCENY